ncbi:EF hand domain/PKD domain protein [Desulfosporosinus metallidurans]|uniref:EF hand domain/PKD domain protein n=2 Tax=Desulfosporosinus metallidurans TaxID=1888891 RepID=A0A1Q8QRU6_9FIRM|nr:EF hand domain/PKD domain protein [Desulfosporosinus metallidurans]
MFPDSNRGEETKHPADNTSLKDDDAGKGNLTILDQDDLIDSRHDNASSPSNTSRPADAVKDDKQNKVKNETEKASPSNTSENSSSSSNSNSGSSSDNSSPGNSGSGSSSDGSNPGNDGSGNSSDSNNPGNSNSDNSSGSSPGSESGGGSISYPRAQVAFELPATAHTDSEIHVVPTLKYTGSLTWSLTKEAVDGAQTAVELSKAIDGSLTNEGGTITFKESGSYTLTATAVNYGGRETICTKSIIVYPVVDVSFDLPEYTHTDRTVTIATYAKLDGLNIVWSVAKDGEVAQLESIIEGSLGSDGGTVAFKTKGSYAITATVTDATGRSFTHSESVAIFPVAGVAFELPATAHTDTSIELVTSLTEMDGLTAEWSLTKNGEAVAISDAIDGSLTNAVGKIRFKQKGVYLLTAKVTDKSGRAFETKATTTVYPVGAAGFYLPEITHTDTAVTVEATFQNIDTAIAVWSLTKEDKETAIDDYIEGTLTNDGGTIRFKEKGKYVLKAAFTDGAGRTYSYTSTVTVYPVPSLTFQMPATAHTDTNLKIDTTTTEMDRLTVEWLVDNTYGFQDWSTYVDGKLKNDGGTIRFKHAGVYELVARVTDATGRVFLFETGDKIEVHPVLDIRFELTESTYTDRTIDLRTTGNIGVLPIEWSITKNSKTVPFETNVNGTLNAQGGKIRFTEAGEYTLTASMTDALGRTFSYSGTVTVYPISEIQLALPEVAYAGEAVTATVSGSNLENLTVAWTISTDDGDTNPYTDYANGSLSNEGGSITFKAKGSYVMTATMTDVLGRTFSESKAIIVYPIPEIQLTLPQVSYAGEAIAVAVSGNNIDNLSATWTISANDGIAAIYTDYASGSLSNDGGSITFKAKGNYMLTVTMTDTLGRTFYDSRAITVYSIPEIQLTIPQVSYAGEAVAVTVSGSDLENLTTTWTISANDSTAATYTDYAGGSLSNERGSITFAEKGSYVLIVTMTDVLGRTFSESKAITIYSIPDMQISLPQLTYSGEALPVTIAGSELNGLNIIWSMSVDGGTTVPYTQYATGTLGNNGGELRISTDKTIIVKLIATAKDDNGRSFTFVSGTATVKPTVQCSFTIPSSVHVGTNFNVSMKSVSGLEGKSIVWSLTKDGSAASYTGSLNNNGGSIAVGATGTYTLTASVTDDASRVFTHSENVTITNTAPNKPTASATMTRTVKDQKFLVNSTVSSTDPDGDTVIYEYSSQSADGYYAAGSHTVKVRAKDAYGAYSDWTDINFTITNSAPSTPVITRTPNGNSVTPNTLVTITASSTDPEGDAITYLWEGRPSQTSAYPLGKNTVRVKAVDAAGAESPWTAIVFFVADSTNGGGMTLTGPESVILEQGLAGATITEYTFTVPPVSGHSGSDYGRVRGYNVKKGVWDQLDYQTTTNGITFSRTLTAGVYSQLEFYYYTNHNCMYNKSNITYSVTYYFE